MKKHTNIPLILLAAASVCACSDDSTLNHQDNDTTNCQNECEIGESSCDGAKIRLCENNENNCQVWGASIDCDPGMTCDNVSDSCVEGCVDECHKGDTECSDSLIKTCVKSEQSECMIWGSAESCGSDKHCENGDCVNGCVDECTEGQSVCDGDNVRTCGQFDDDSCLELSDPVECGTDSYCLDSTGKCQRLPCSDECSLGEITCSQGKDAVLKCEAVQDGCFGFVLDKECSENSSCSDKSGTADCVENIVKICEEGDKKCADDGKSVLECEVNETTNAWKETPCTGNDICDTATISCQSSCKDACSDGDVQCSAKNPAVIQKCQLSDNGCMVWADQETCPTAQSCKGGKCEYNCGNDCEPFSIVLLPDTQNYTRTDAKAANDKYSEDTTYQKQMNWIVTKNKEKSSIMPNLKMVIHLGDITNNNIEAQWKTARHAQNILRDNKIPFTIITGNHDYKIDTYNSTRGNSKFPDYFPKSYLEKLPGYKGIYDKINTYFTFKAGNQDYLILNLEYSPRQQTICWANSLLQKEEFKNHKVIVVTHAYLSHTFQKSENGKQTRADAPSRTGNVTITDAPNGASGSELWSELISCHSNIILALSGHVGDTEFRMDKGNNGNNVAQILTDYQFEAPCNADKASNCIKHCSHVPGAGNGWLRILTFDPKTNKVSVNTTTVIPTSTAHFSKEKKVQFYCSELNSHADQSTKSLLAGQDSSKSTYVYKDDSSWYPSALNAGESHYTATNYQKKEYGHIYDFDLDFTSKTQNVYIANKAKTFAHRSVNYTSNGDQRHPSIATNASGRMIVVWEDDSFDDGKQYNSSVNAHDIFGRIMLPECCNLDGNNEIIINSNQKGHQFDPDVAMDKDGNFVVVWTDDTDGNGRYEILMRGFNADGTERFKTKAVNAVSDGDQTHARIAMAPDGIFAVSWTDTRSGDQKPQIYFRGFNANGTESISERTVADSIAGTRVNSDIFMDQNHNIYIAWEDDEDGNGATQARMRFINADGSYKTATLMVNTNANGNQDTPAISGLSDGSKISVTWLNTLSNVTTIMARTFDSNGNQIDADKTVSNTAGSLSDPQICLTNKGESILTWHNETKRDVIAKAFNGKSETTINTPSNVAESNKRGNSNGRKANSTEPAVACVPNTNTVYFVYSDDNDGNGYYEIYSFGKSF